MGANQVPQNAKLPSQLHINNCEGYKLKLQLVEQLNLT